MKHLTFLLAVTVWFAGATIGCGSRYKVDTSKLEQAFQSAPAAQKSDATQAVTAIKSGDFAAAVTSLKKVVSAGGLNPEQKDAITTAVTGMQMVAADNQRKYSLEVYTSLSDLIALTEGQPIIAK